MNPASKRYSQELHQSVIINPQPAQPQQQSLFSNYKWIGNQSAAPNKTQLDAKIQAVLNNFKTRSRQNSIASLLLRPLQRYSTVQRPNNQMQSGYQAVSLGHMDPINRRDCSDLPSLRSLKDH